MALLRRAGWHWSACRTGSGGRHAAGEAGPRLRRLDAFAFPWQPRQTSIPTYLAGPAEKALEAFVDIYPDTAYRLDGDEFTIEFPSTVTTAHVSALLDAFRLVGMQEVAENRWRLPTKIEAVTTGRYL